MERLSPHKLTLCSLLKIYVQPRDNDHSTSPYTIVHSDVKVRVPLDITLARMEVSPIYTYVLTPLTQILAKFIGDEIALVDNATERSLGDFLNVLSTLPPSLGMSVTIIIYIHI
jgi:hypothetical protein